MNKEEMPNNPIVEEEKKKIVKAELSYNPILEETKVKFNGRSPRINSLIEKYQHKKLQEWIEDLPAVFYDEMNGYEFDLLFSGTELDFNEIKRVLREKSITTKMINPRHLNLLDSRIEKARLLQKALVWLDKNRNHYLDYDELKEQYDDLFFGPFQFKVIGGNIREIKLYEGLEIQVENIDSFSELYNVPLKNIPVLFCIDNETVIDLQPNLTLIKKRKKEIGNISYDQIFFYIHPSLNIGNIKRVITDMGLSAPQIIKNLDDYTLKKYFQIFPVGDRIAETCKILRQKIREIDLILSEEIKLREDENTDKYTLIKEYEKNIEALKASDELFINQDRPDYVSEWSILKEKMLDQIRNWQSWRTKASGQKDGENWASDFDRQFTRFFSDFVRDISTSRYKHKSQIDQNMYLWYRQAGLDVLYHGSKAISRGLSFENAPSIAENLLSIKTEKYVVPKDDNILGFVFKNQKKEDLVPELEITYSFQAWREYVLSIAENLANTIITQCEENLIDYISELTATYREHIAALLSEETSKKDFVTSGLSEEAKILQDDKNWLTELDDQISHIEKD